VQGGIEGNGVERDDAINRGLSATDLRKLSVDSVRGRTFDAAAKAGEHADVYPSNARDVAHVKATVSGAARLQDDGNDEGEGEGLLSVRMARESTQSVTGDIEAGPRLSLPPGRGRLSVQEQVQLLVGNRAMQVFLLVALCMGSCFGTIGGFLFVYLET